MQARSAAGQPLIQSGDTIGLLLKATPDSGTATGAGGYSTFFVPIGTQVVNAEYGRLDTNGAFVPMPMKGQSILSLGDGTIGAKATPNLIGLELGPNVVGQTSLAVDANGLARGTLAGVYSDTGIFYSTDPKTTWQSWVLTGGVDGNALTTNDNQITNNSGDFIIPTTRWDAEQLMAFGMRSPSAPLIDTVDGRGNTPWGMGSAVAGPESSYAWCFDKTSWDANANSQLRMKQAIAVGPWQRIQYPGSLAAKDTPGLHSTTLGYVGVDASDLGYELSQQHPLPVTTSLTDTTSPKAVRFAWGFLELYRPEYARLQIKIINGPGQPNSSFSHDGVLQAYADTFGGDAGGEFGNKDHLWRYYQPSTVKLPDGPYLFKQVSKSNVLRNEVFSYKVWVANFSNQALTNLFVEDALPTGTAFVSATPPQLSGPNPLRWSLPTMPPQSMQSFVVNVKATSSGIVTNSATTYDDHHIPTTAGDTVTEGPLALLYADKTVVPSSALPGDTVDYTMTFLNGGTAASSPSLVITDRLPDGFSYVSLLAADVNEQPINAGSIAVNTSDPARPVFTVNRSINPNKQLHITFRAQISTTEPAGKYCNQLNYTYDSKMLATGGLACVTVGQRDFGLGIGNLVFFDTNGNGHADPGEGVANVTIELYGDGQTAGVDTPLDTATTDATGQYLFHNMQSGFYFVHIPSSMFQPGAPLHTYVSIAEGFYGDDDVGEDGLNNTDPPTEGVSSSPVFVGFGFAPTDQDGETGFNHTMDNGIDAAVNLTVDFGFQTPVGIGNLVFIDANNNGHADPGEGVAGVRVELYNATDPVESSAYLYAITTDANGHYLFNNLASGDYVVHIPSVNFQPDQPLYQLLSVSDISGHPTGDDDVGENGVDSLAPAITGISSDVIHLAGGTAPVDASPGSATGETGYLASEDNLRDNSVDLTVDFGFTAIPPPYVGVGNLVFEDLNGNQRFDPGEGVAGVTVQLFAASVTNPQVATPLRTKVTSNDGSYFFNDLQPGDYFVYVPPANFGPSGPLYKRLSLPGSGGDNGIDDDFDENGEDSPNPDVTGIRSNTFHLAFGTEPTGIGTEAGFNAYADDGVDSNYDLTIDLGFYQFVGVGNLVFKDTNGNGHFDPGEGIGGVPVQLFALGADPEFDTPIRSTVSANDGRYSFMGLTPGTYFIHVPAIAFAPGEALFACLSVPDTGLLPGGDDDVDEDGVDAPTPLASGISSHAFTLSPGMAPTNASRENGFGASDDDTYDSNIDFTIDLGFYQSGLPILGAGNLVFIDANHNGLHDAGEGVEGVTIQLFVAGADPLSAIPVSTTVTDARGAYLLTTNQPGDYFVFIPPVQFQSGRHLYGYHSLTGNGGDDGLDDDVDENGIDSPTPSTTGIASNVFHLAAGTEPNETGYLADMDAVTDSNIDLTIDFGFELVCPTVTISPANLANAVATVHYSQTLSASGSYGPYTWDVVNGSLPPGMILDPAGLLSGQAPEADTYSFTLRATDVVGCSATVTYQLAIVPMPTVGLGNAIYIDANHNGIRDSDEGVENVEVELFHAGDDPLTAVPVQEVVTDVAGTYWFTGLPEGDYFAYVGASEFASGRPLHGLISIPGVSSDDGVDDNLPNNDNGIDSDHPEVTGIMSVVAHLRFGQEPILSETGVDGTLDDSNDANVDATIDLGFRDPCPPIVITPGQLPIVTTSIAYAQQLSATGGTGAITFSLNAGSLPAGITLSSSGLLSGMTTTLGTFNVTIRGADTDGCLFDLTTTLVVNSPVAVGNLIFFDKNNNGHADEGEGVDGVTVQLYTSTQTPGVDAPLKTTITSGGGRWLIDSLAPGNYRLHVPATMFAIAAPLQNMISIPGVTTSGDDDVGEDGEDAVSPASTGVSTDVFTLANGTMPSGLAESGLSGSSDDTRDADIDLTRDLGFVDANALPATFASWQTAHHLSGAPTANGDGDADNDLLEYALATNPSSGIGAASHFTVIEDQTTTRMRVQLQRRHGGQNDLTYTVQLLGNLAQSPGGWATTSITPTITNNGDGTETLTFPNIDLDPGLQGSSTGFVRLVVGLDANHDNTPEATATSAVLGWQHRSLSVQHQTYGLAFVKPAVFTGVVDAVNGSTLNITSSIGTGNLVNSLTAGLPYYAEVIAGDNEGQRWEIDESACTATSIVLLPSIAPSTQSTIPANLAGDIIAVRPHWRVVDLFPPADFHATGSASTADQILLWNSATSGYITLYLNTVSGNKTWLKFGGVGLNIQDNTVIGPTDGMFARPRVGSVNATVCGQVRTWKFAFPLAAGLNFVGNPYPVSQSFADRMMNAAHGFTGAGSVNAADKINYWNGDASTNTSYSIYYLFKNATLERWLRVGQVGGVDHANDKLFDPGTGVFINSISGNATWVLPVPWTP